MSVSTVAAAKTRHIAAAIGREIGKAELLKFKQYHDKIKNKRNHTLTTVELEQHLMSIKKLPVTKEELNQFLEALKIELSK